MIGTYSISGHPIRNAPETRFWQITLQKSTEGSFYTGTISNTILRDEIPRFANKEESDVVLQPINLSVEADRADRSMDLYEDHLNVDFKALEGFFISQS